MRELKIGAAQFEARDADKKHNLGEVLGDLGDRGIA